ncbi:formate-dependent phosphoribosylglycinamide formyltransferase [Prochlorothrix hollandica]|uniref:Formate-dependent phosphoribosylglycinamide formyltransferase n=1 Tax=Prochlorothrix hollandica PCC 9006 = CALU 1027 TaxID=317619 RepID=A0A0M2Q2Q8_PROHO|nr:formate-dependent phosphoribosylglycinamide formyltransferase [Prochlorothrix hollandica]KKJ01254.1 phosphoribosylglycinamide formyltransferase [Prochlorothrix hollandica PCC 9006 = CALU 1027]
MPNPTPTAPWGTPLQSHSQRLLILGSGELGKEVAIEALRLGLEVIAVDSYAQAPAMQVAHRSHVVDMLDGDKLRFLVERERPTWIVPEVEAIATETLIALETEGWQVTPTARATHLTMDREGIRRLAAEELGLQTSPYRFASDRATYRDAVAAVGLPCVVKPVMSSSGKGQSVVRSAADIDAAWDYAQTAGRTQKARVIVEGFVNFETEITLLTVRSASGTHFCAPIGHVQQEGDYRESWQPCPLNPDTLAQCQAMAEKITTALGGWGLFGVELFIAESGSGSGSGSEPESQPQTVYFSEVSPRPHDTGMVTMISQNMSEFELHVRAITGLPIGEIQVLQPGASAVILAGHRGQDPQFLGVAEALTVPTTKLRLFGKPMTRRDRRMGVALALGATVEEARQRAKACADRVQVVSQES